MQTYKLQNRNDIPMIGFGTWKLKGSVAYQSVKEALNLGYRHIDTAAVYDNEKEVGQAIIDSGVPRDQIFLTTKIWNSEITYEDAVLAIDASLQRLQTDYIDLLLIHWPNPITCRENEAWKDRNANLWRAMEEAYESGKVRAIGVSNFMVHHLEALLTTVKITPMINQIKLAPGITQDEVVHFCRKHNILLEAYSPLGSGDLFNNPTLKEISEKYNKSIAQIALRWSLHHQFLPLPRSKTPANIANNLDVFEFDLKEEDIERLNNIPVQSAAPNPDVRNF